MAAKSRVRWSTRPDLKKRMDALIKATKRAQAHVVYSALDSLFKALEKKPANAKGIGEHLAGIKIKSDNSIKPSEGIQLYWEKQPELAKQTEHWIEKSGTDQTKIVFYALEMYLDALEPKLAKALAEIKQYEQTKISKLREFVKSPEAIPIKLK